MRAGIGVLLALWLALAQQPTITAFWQGDVLVIVASPGSLYLVGGNRQDQFIGRNHVELPAYGVSDQVSPVGRTWIVLRDTDGRDVVKIGVPPLRGVRVWLPAVAREAGWRIILPIVVRDNATHPSGALNTSE